MRSSEIPFVLKPLHIVRDSEGLRVAPAPPKKNYNAPTYTGSLSSFVSLFEDPASSEDIRKRMKPYTSIAEYVDWKRQTRIDKNDKKNREAASEWNPFTQIPEKTDLLKTSNDKLPQKFLPTETPFNSLFVWGLKYSTTADMLATFLSDFGPVRRCHIVHETITPPKTDETDEPTLEQGPSRGYGFVEFETQHDAERALNQISSTPCYLEGFKIKVDIERGRTVYGWLPASLGGGLGANSRSSKQSTKSLRKQEQNKKKSAFRKSRRESSHQDDRNNSNNRFIDNGRDRRPRDSPRGGFRDHRDRRPRNDSRFRQDSRHHGGFQPNRSDSFRRSDPNRSRDYQSDFQNSRNARDSRDGPRFDSRNKSSPHDSRNFGHDEPRNSKFDVFGSTYDSRDFRSRDRFSSRDRDFQPKYPKSRDYRSHSPHNDRPERSPWRDRNNRYSGSREPPGDSEFWAGDNRESSLGTSSMRQRRPPSHREESYDRNRRPYRS